MSFESAFDEVVMLEGGYVNHPLDRGGKTKYGISQRAYPDLDILNLTLEDARKIYKRDYWDFLKLNLVYSGLIRGEMFDTGVNMGTWSAADCAQRACNLLSPGSLRLDRIIGPKSIAVINDLAAQDLYALYKAMNGFQFVRYVEILEEDPEQVEFIKGWMRRLKDFNRKRG